MLALWIASDVRGIQANGFLGSKGLSGLIPEAYTLLEKRFWNKVLKAKRQWHTEGGGGIELREWRKDGWTYHAKGRYRLLRLICLLNFSKAYGSPRRAMSHL